MRSREVDDLQKDLSRAERSRSLSHSEKSDSKKEREFEEDSIIRQLYSPETKSLDKLQKEMNLATPKGHFSAHERSSSNYSLPQLDFSDNKKQAGINEQAKVLAAGGAIATAAASDVLLGTRFGLAASMVNTGIAVSSGIAKAVDAGMGQKAAAKTSQQDYVDLKAAGEAINKIGSEVAGISGTVGKVAQNVSSYLGDSIASVGNAIGKSIADGSHNAIPKASAMKALESGAQAGSAAGDIASIARLQNNSALKPESISKLIENTSLANTSDLNKNLKTQEPAQEQSIRETTTSAKDLQNSVQKGELAGQTQQEEKKAEPGFKSDLGDKQDQTVKSDSSPAQQAPQTKPESQVKTEAPQSKPEASLPKAEAAKLEPSKLEAPKPAAAPVQKEPAPAASPAVKNETAAKTAETKGQIAGTNTEAGSKPGAADQRQASQKLDGQPATTLAHNSAGAKTAGETAAAHNLASQKIEAQKAPLQAQLSAESKLNGPIQANSALPVDNRPNLESGKQISAKTEPAHAAQASKDTGSAAPNGSRPAQETAQKGLVQPVSRNEEAAANLKVNQNNSAQRQDAAIQQAAVRANAVQNSPVFRPEAQRVDAQKADGLSARVEPGTRADTGSKADRPDTAIRTASERAVSANAASALRPVDLQNAQALSGRRIVDSSNNQRYLTGLEIGLIIAAAGIAKARLNNNQTAQALKADQLISTRSGKELSISPKLLQEACAGKVFISDLAKGARRFPGKEITLSAVIALSSTGKLRELEINKTQNKVQEQQTLRLEKPLEKPSKTSEIIFEALQFFKKEEEEKKPGILDHLVGLGTFTAMPGLFRSRRKDECPEDEDKNADAGADSSSSQVQQVLPARRTHKIKSGESLLSIAESKLHDGYLSWLIADLNKDKTTEHIVEGRRVVEIRAGQQLELPSPREIAKFYSKIDSACHPDNLITIVVDSKMDRSHVENNLRAILGLRRDSV